MAPDLAQVVLEAAKKEQGKDLLHHDAQQGNQDGEPSSPPTPVGAYTSKSKPSNGHLAPPFEWNNGDSESNLTHRQQLTASPEPLTHTELPPSKEGEDRANGRGGSGKQDDARQATNDSVESTSTPATKRPATKAPRRYSKKLSANLFSGGGSGSGRGDALQQRRQHKVTSESTHDENDDDGEVGVGGYTSSSSREASGPGPKQGRDSIDALVGTNPAAASHTHPGGSGASGAPAASPMRGPFSRYDSSRGQSMLRQESSPSGLNKLPNGNSSAQQQQHHHPHHHPHHQDGSAPPSKRGSLLTRRQSTGATGDSSGGSSSRRPSMSAASRLFSSVRGMLDEGDETAGEDQDRYRGVRTPRRSTEEQQPQGSQQARQQQQHNTDAGNVSGGDQQGSGQGLRPTASRSNTLGIAGLPRGEAARTKWAALRQRLKQEKKPEELEKSLTGSELITDLSTGMMSVMMLKMAFDRDEHDQHRIPVLLNYLKLRITDSVYPFHSTHANFRIELEYGDGLLKWVIYRELRDFVNLHAHYRVANVTHSLDRFPPFPKVSIPYWNYLKKESREKGANAPGKAEFAKMQREALENYLLRLIRAVMFRPEANRLCKFLEFSAMSLQLATKGGSHGKQGYLRVLSSGASRHQKPGFRPLALKRRHEPKWFMVRESYIVATDEPYSTKIWDVFFVDTDFRIERPKRLYRQGINLFSDGKHTDPREKVEGLPDGLQSFEGVDGPKGGGVGDPNDPSTTDAAKSDPKALKNASIHTFYIRNAERKIKLVAKSERQMDQFINSLEKMAEKSIWASKNRFGSFAPIRLNVAAQWLVDGRDYYWNLSRAILLAKEKIYIHDWWLSPELYLRRPPAENGRWRLDRLLQRKAEEGVQIHVIVYNEVSNDFTPVDSVHTKSTLTALHRNIMVQRSPNHAQTRTFLWSHHEKLCVIDDTIAFMGGLDLCFGRWDTPAHSMVDDGPPLKDDLDLPDHANEHAKNESGHVESQIWPGKDYANSRVSDYYELTKPFEDMYDRTKTPREPWHDIGLQIIGQPARDLARHFIQRWNLLLRTKSHRRFMPFLLPPPDFTAKELAKLQLTGTCETQICRSAGPWSIGTPNKIEHSIQTAYIKAIQMSDHFVYIENQFFITSTVVEGTAIENNIGNAIVARIQQAHMEGTPWRAIIVIPLEPGYPMPVDHPDAGSVRLIMECQFRTICRGENSIYARLRRDGIDPTEYISFYSLRSWARMQDGSLATSGVYIHAKCMVVDDRIAIIGSANINERSQRGDRDSELACVIRDVDMIDSTMAGKPYKVGRFAHTLRIRLMREHLGVDVDALEEEEANMDLMSREPSLDPEDIETWDPRREQGTSGTTGVQREKGHRTRAAHTLKKAGEIISETAHGVAEAGAANAERAIPRIDEDVASKFGGKPQQDGAHTTLTEEGEPTDGDEIVTGHRDGRGFASTVVPTLEEKFYAEKKKLGDVPDANATGAAERRHSRRNEEKGNLEPPNSARTDGGADGGGGEQMDDLSKTRGQQTTQYSKEAHDTRQFVDNQAETQNTATPPDIKKAQPIGGDDAGRREEEGEEEARVTEGSETSRSPRHARVQSNGTVRSSDSKPEKEKTASTSKVSKSNEQIANNNKVDSAIRKGLDTSNKKNPYTVPTRRPKIDAKKFADPLIDSFYKDMWVAAAVHNTGIYRKVFRCAPDDLITTWAMMKECAAWHKRHEKSGRGGPNDNTATSNGNGSSPPTLSKGDSSLGGPLASAPTSDSAHEKHGAKGGSVLSNITLPHSKSATEGTAADGEAKKKEKDKVKNSMEEAFSEEEIEQMMNLLEQTTGNLVAFPTRFLEAESAGQNFLWSKDRIPPIAIYN